MPQDPMQTIDVTIRVRGNYNKRTLQEAFSPDHAYGPVKRLTIRREDHSTNISPKILSVDVEVVDSNSSGGAPDDE